MKYNKCTHCNNKPSTIYTHYVDGITICGDCGKSINTNINEDILKYLGITEMNNIMVHLYKRITLLSCPECGSNFNFAYYDCENDGALITINKHAYIEDNNEDTR